MESAKEALEKLKEAMTKEKDLYSNLRPIYKNLKTVIEETESRTRLNDIFVKLDIEDSWKRLGIPTRYESKLCLALYLSGELSPRQLHEKTGVPLPKVYQTVKKLQDSNIVKKTGEKGKTKIELVSDDIKNELEKHLKQEES